MAEAAKYQVAEMDDQWLRKQVKCMNACPVNTNAAGYIALIAAGRFYEAYELAKEPNPFVNVCARVCAHPCEIACRRSDLDQPISICGLKRFAYDNRGELAARPRPPQRSERVAIIGAGPAGLACAHDLALKGYQVTVFEAASVPGGQCWLGVPEYRLPRHIIQEDVKEITDLGVEIKYNTMVGRDVELADLRRDYHAVFIAVGYSKSRHLNIPGADHPDVHKGIEFLARMHLGENVKLGQRVVVIGGGNVAMDVARGALRCEGAEEVQITCLEAEGQMPAWDFEIHEAVEEGIKINNSLGPRRIIIEGGKIAGLEVIKVKSVFDETGRFNPSFYEGSEFAIPCDTVMLAIGQASDLSFIKPEDGIEVHPRGTIVADLETCATTAPGVFAGGDVAFGPKLIIDAVSHGRKAAKAIHRYISSQEEKTRMVRYMEKIDWCRDKDDYILRDRVAMPTLDKGARKENPLREVDLGYTPEQAVAEAQRCLHCFINPWYEAEKCIMCGACVDVCPEDCLRMVPVKELDDPVLAGMDEDATVMLKDEDVCIRCGLCAYRCPTEAMTMQRFFWKEETISAD